MVNEVQASDGALADGRHEIGNDIILVANGEKWILPAFEKGDFKVVEDHLSSIRKPAVQALAEAADEIAKAPPFLREGLIDRCYKRLENAAALDGLSHQVVHEWLDTTDGAVYSIYIQLRKRYPEITQEKSKDIMETVGLAEFLKARDQASKSLTGLRDKVAKALE